MSSDSAETRRLTKPYTPGAPLLEQEQHPCPRCNSPNTKFCYYNNYNSSQPRHFCKSCRRYWTHGGTLRDIPVGGGTRKNAKRSRTAINGSSTPVVITTATGNTGHGLPLPATPILVPLTANQGAFGVGGGSDFDVKGNGTGGMCGSFTSLLSTQGPGFLALGGFGLGIGSGFEDVNFGPGRGVWPFTGVGDGAVGLGSNGAAATAMANTWQFESGETGFVGGDCFSWPDLAISTPANGVK